MNDHYTSEKQAQILMALMKFHGIKKVIASPGATTICILGSMQADPYFELYSAVDERSAAYMALGMTAEGGEPVALVCTGSTASRNYVPGLTEAFYRKLPILAITTTQLKGRIGNAYQQVIDRSQQMKDLVVESVQLNYVHTEEDAWACGVAVNKALIALRKNGGGPVHINLETNYSLDFSVKQLPRVKGIRHYSNLKEMPSLDTYKKIAILVGCHVKWSEELLQSIEKFCETYNAVVLMNHASNYKGNYGVNHAVILSMKNYRRETPDADLVIYIGSIPRYTSGMNKNNCEMWRVNPDGEIRDPEQMLTKVFALEEEEFFAYYADKKSDVSEDFSEYAAQWQSEYESIMSQIPDIPFSNVWVSQNVISKLPDHCVLHLGGSHTARSWNLFKLPQTVECYSNDGTMGIDGQVSAFVGESLAFPDRLHFCAVGDLTFFYDMNSIGNRYIGNNIRILVINNGKGVEFRLYFQRTHIFEEDADPYMAAEGHYGNKSPNLLRHYAEDLGFEYMCASSKDEFLNKLERFVTPESTDKPMFFEVFTETEDEDVAIYAMQHMVENVKPGAVDTAKGMVKSVIGEKGVKVAKKLLKH